MKDEIEYFTYQKAILTQNSKVLHFEVIKELNIGDEGYYRYKILLADSSILEVYQKFQVTPSGIIPKRYSYHLQSSTGELIIRWDNAPHHTELQNFPHHIHKNESLVISGDWIDLESVLGTI